jgi:hypothetical protein
MIHRYRYICTHTHAHIHTHAHAHAHTHTHTPWHTHTHLHGGASCVPKGPAHAILECHICGLQKSCCPRPFGDDVGGGEAQAHGAAGGDEVLACVLCAKVLVIKHGDHQAQQRKAKAEAENDDIAGVLGQRRLALEERCAAGKRAEVEEIAHHRQRAAAVEKCRRGIDITRTICIHCIAREKGRVGKRARDASVLQVQVEPGARLDLTRRRTSCSERSGRSLLPASSVARRDRWEESEAWGVLLNAKIAQRTVQATVWCGFCALGFFEPAVVAHP